MGVRGEVFSARASSGNRTYFFNVKENRAGDLFLNIVESKKHGETGFERHQIVVFEEELTEFLAQFEKAAGFMKQHAKVKPRRPSSYDNRERYHDGSDRRDAPDRRGGPDRRDEPKGDNKERRATVRLRRKPQE